MFNKLDQLNQNVREFGHIHSGFIPLNKIKKLLLIKLFQQLKTKAMKKKES